MRQRGRIGERRVGIRQDRVPFAVGNFNFRELVVCPFVRGPTIVGVENWSALYLQSIANFCQADGVLEGVVDCIERRLEILVGGGLSLLKRRKVGEALSHSHRRISQLTQNLTIEGAGTLLCHRVADIWLSR